MNRQKNVALLCAGMLIGTAMGGPAAQAVDHILAERSTQPIFVDGKQVELEAYRAPLKTAYIYAIILKFGNRQRLTLSRQNNWASSTYLDLKSSINLLLGATIPWQTAFDLKIPSGTCCKSSWLTQC